jgi:hypothetical protein
MGGNPESGWESCSGDKMGAPFMRSFNAHEWEGWMLQNLVPLAVTERLPRHGRGRPTSNRPSSSCKFRHSYTCRYAFFVYLATCRYANFAHLQPQLPTRSYTLPRAKSRCRGRWRRPLPRRDNEKPRPRPGFVVEIVDYIAATKSGTSTAAFSCSS